jgi:hypothetical protein
VGKKPSAELGRAITKRELLLVGGCAVCGALIGQSMTSARASGRLFEGCFISPEAFQQFRTEHQRMRSPKEGLIPKNKYDRTTGDQEVNRKLDRAMRGVAELFKVKPAFGFYDPKKYHDEPAMQAWFIREDTDIPGTRGTVGFANDLFSSELNEYDKSGSTIMAIIAHEFAHVAQGNLGYLKEENKGLKRGNPQMSEIHADFLAGYFLGTRKRQYPQLSFVKAKELFIRLGAENFLRAENLPSRTHGTSKERLAGC